MTRRRTVRLVVGFVVGFLASWAVIQAVGSATDEELAADPVVIGALDFSRYCRISEGDQIAATLIADDAEGWRCAGRRDGIWGTTTIDVDRACRVLHGPGSWAVTSDESSPHEWHCVRQA